jgi:hypothetical protein
VANDRKDRSFDDAPWSRAMSKPMAQAVTKQTTSPYEKSFCHFQRMESIMPFIAVGQRMESARPAAHPRVRCGHTAAGIKGSITAEAAGEGKGNYEISMNRLGTC